MTANPQPLANYRSVTTRRRDPAPRQRDLRKPVCCPIVLADMSALGQKRTSSEVCVMSALPPIADIGTQPRDVRFVPKADIGEGATDVRFTPKSGHSSVRL